MVREELKSLIGQRWGGASSERNDEGVTERRILGDSSSGTNQNEGLSEGQADQNSTKALDGQIKDLFQSPAPSKGKRKAIGFDQEASENAARGCSLPKDKGKARAVEYWTKYDVYDMPDQSFAEDIIAQTGDLIEHTSVSCDEPLCTEPYIPSARSEGEGPAMSNDIVAPPTLSETDAVSLILTACPDNLNGTACHEKDYCSEVYLCKDFADPKKGCSFDRSTHATADGKTVLHILKTCRALLKNPPEPCKMGKSCIFGHDHPEVRRQVYDQRMERKHRTRQENEKAKAVPIAERESKSARHSARAKARRQEFLAQNR